MRRARHATWRVVGALAIAALAIAPLASAQLHTASGTVSVYAGGGMCSDSDQDNLSPNPIATTSAFCVAQDGSSASGGTVADLAAGKVGLAISTSPLPSSAGGAAMSGLTDRLTFTVAGGIEPNEDLLVGVTFTLAGELSPDAAFDFQFGRFLDYSFAFSDSYSLAADHFFSASGSVDSTSFTSPQVFTNVVKVRGAFLTADVGMNLSLPGIHQGSVDFLNSATIALDLPPGVTFTSASGVFLTAPEPGAFARAAGVLLPLWVVARRRSGSGR
jgi:hypothetical protein